MEEHPDKRNIIFHVSTTTCIIIFCYDFQNKTKQEKEKQKEGNRIGRMVKDGLVSSKHCEELMDLAKVG